MENEIKLSICSVGDVGVDVFLGDLIEEECARLLCSKKIKQKRAAYSMLFSEVKNRFGIDEPFRFLKKDENGKPFFDDNRLKNFFFSLSHSEDIACLVTSNFPVGVDVQKVKKFSDKLFNKIFSDNEKSELKELDDVAKTLTWAKKESAFKLSDRNVFLPCSIDATQVDVFFKSLTFVFNNETYAVCVAAEKDFVENVRFLYTLSPIMSITWQS